MPLAAHPAAADPGIDFLRRDSCRAFCDQRRATLRKDEEALALARDELVRAQREAVVQGLCTLTRDVREMSVGEFDAAFGCDLIDLIRKQLAAGDVGGGGGAKRVRVPADAPTAAGVGASFKTPAPHRVAGRPPATMRTVRKGETAYSANGSPIDITDHGEMVVTVKKRRGAAAAGGGAGAGTAAAGAAFPMSIGIGMGNGERIDLADPAQRGNLDGEQKTEALQQLMAIQEQMNKLMAEF